MPVARSHADLHNVRLGAERIKRLSDRVVGIGPFGIGLDGVLSFFPVVGVIYSVLAGLMLLADALRARAAPGVIMHMSVLLGINTVLDLPANIVPGVGGVVGGVADTLFTGHKWAADVLLKHMDETLYIEGSRDRTSPEHADLMARVRAGKERRRIVYLG